jgi:hypothetical protein
MFNSHDIRRAAASWVKLSSDDGKALAGDPGGARGGRGVRVLLVGW